MNGTKLADWSFWTSTCFIVLLILLHFIKSDIDPSWNFISEYEVGRFGWIMQLAFLSLASGCIFIVLTLWKPLNVVGKIGLIMVIIAAIGMITAAIFKTDALNTPLSLQTQSGRLHQLGAMLDQIPFGAILITVALFKKKEWKIDKPLLIIALILIWFGFIYFVGSIKAQFPADGKFGQNVLVGWQNRIMIHAGGLAGNNCDTNQKANHEPRRSSLTTVRLASFFLICTANIGSLRVRFLLIFSASVFQSAYRMLAAS